MVATNKIVIAVAGDPPETVRELHGDYPRMMSNAIGTAWSGEYEILDVRDGLSVGEASDAAAVIVTGSSANVHTRERWIVETEAWLRQLVELGTPVLGVCFGHQLLAQALGGEVQRSPQGREMSTVSIDKLVDDPIFRGVPDTFSANAHHSDTVLRCPDSAIVLAKNSHDAHQVLRFGPRCYGVQFHPEFGQHVMRAFVDERAGSLLREGKDPTAYRERAAETPYSQGVMKNFVSHVVKAP